MKMRDRQVCERNKHYTNNKLIAKEFQPRIKEINTDYISFPQDGAVWYILRFIGDNFLFKCDRFRWNL